MRKPILTNPLRNAVLISALLIAACKPATPDLQQARQSASVARAEAAKKSAMVDETPPGSASDKTALSPAQESLVVARVGESTITLGDVARHIARQPRSTRSRFVSPEQRIALLNNLVEFELLANEAKRLKLDERPAVQLALKAALAQE